MAELIDRQAAIDALKPCAGVGNRALDKLRALPTVEPKKGRWMHHEDKAYAGDGYEECSCCKWRCADWVFIEDSNYCPSCGAKMEGGEADG